MLRRSPRLLKRYEILVILVQVDDKRQIRSKGRCEQDGHLFELKVKQASIFDDETDWNNHLHTWLASGAAPCISMYLRGPWSWITTSRISNFAWTMKAISSASQRLQASSMMGTGFRRPLFLDIQQSLTHQKNKWGENGKWKFANCGNISIHLTARDIHVKNDKNRQGPSEKPRIASVPDDESIQTEVTIERGRLVGDREVNLNTF